MVSLWTLDSLVLFYFRHGQEVPLPLAEKFDPAMLLRRRFMVLR